MCPSMSKTWWRPATLIFSGGVHLSRLLRSPPAMSGIDVLEPHRETEHIYDDGNLRPIPKSQRTFSRWDIAGLWLSMVINVTGFYLAGSLVDLGMSWWQGVLIIVLGNTIILAAAILTAAPGTRYGIPFPVLLRAAFGIRGAHIPALLRAFVACGWCGVENWIGGQGIFLLLPSSLTGSSYAQMIPWLGTSVLELSCFVLFSLIELIILWKGMRGVRVLQKYSAPVLVLLVAWLFAWGYVKAGGLGEMLATQSRLSPSEFWSLFFPSLTASIATWSSVSLNIPDFTRFAKSQTDQILGQMGLPIFMGTYTFIGLAIASSTKVIFGQVISNPIKILSKIGGTFTAIIAISGISLSVVTTNIPANIIAPTYVLISISPSTFTFMGGAVLTTLISTAFLPWRILGSSGNFVYAWLGGYAAILGPITGILLADYYVLRGTILDVDALFSENPLEPYYYLGGYNLNALVALVVSVAPTVPGFLHKVGILAATSGVLVAIYDNAWFFGILSAAIVYWVLCRCCSVEAKARAAPSLLDPLRGSV